MDRSWSSLGVLACASPPAIEPFGTSQLALRVLELFLRLLHHAGSNLHLIWVRYMHAWQRNHTFEHDWR